MKKSNQIYVDRVKWASNLITVRPAICVEVGVWKADFAKPMLEENKDLLWYGVDPYMPYGKMKRKQPAWDQIYERVVKKMAPFGDRFRLLRHPSNVALSHLPVDVDFVFIDGNHDYEFVLSDLAHFEQIIKPGGIMSGHDFTTPKDGVRRAVNDYMNKNRRRLNVDSTFDVSGVWWWVV